LPHLYYMRCKYNRAKRGAPHPCPLPWGEGEEFRKPIPSPPSSGERGRVRGSSIRPRLAGWYILVYMMKTAKLFRNGRSQAVRLPKEFRFAGDEVVVRRSGKRVILEPKEHRRWPPGYWKSWRKVPTDFRAPAPLPSGDRSIDFAS